MPPHLFADLARDLEHLSSLGRLRSLSGVAGHDFTSNDYLAFANSAELRGAAFDALAHGVALGAGGSRLLRGNHAEHDRLERAAEGYFGVESALYFGGGYTANLTLFSTAPQRGDLVVHDEWIHASVLDGLRHTRAEARGVRHNDAQAFDDALVDWRRRGGTGRPWIAVESLYSMDGDGPDLEAMDVVASRHDAVLVIDEAHATGVLGPGGRGRAAFLEGRENVITVHTCGKALGVPGAFVCAPRILIDFLVNRGRAFVFATAPSPLLAAVTESALRLCASSDARRSALQVLVRSASRHFEQRCGREASGSHIMPFIVGADMRAVTLAGALRGRGFDVRAIRPPTVPAGTARLRIAITLNVNEAAIVGLFEALAEENAALAA